MKVREILLMPSKNSASNSTERAQKCRDLDACILDPSLVYAGFSFQESKQLSVFMRACFYIMKGGCLSGTGSFIQLLLNPATHTLNEKSMNTLRAFIAHEYY